MATYLGFDASTQSLTATVIEIAGAARRIVFEHVLDFDAAFPNTARPMAWSRPRTDGT